MERGVCYDQLNNGVVLYKDTPDSLVYFVSGSTAPTEETIYWGKATGGTMNQGLLTTYLANGQFSSATGSIGNLAGKDYVMASTAPIAMYLFFCIPWDPSGSTSGNRVIDNVKIGSNLLVWSNGGSYTNNQKCTGGGSATSACPASSDTTISFAKVTLNGMSYRVYRSANPIWSAAVTVTIKSIT